MFEHVPDLKLDRQDVGRQGEIFRNNMRDISTPENYASLPPEVRWNVAACILIKTQAVTPDMGIDHRARHYIPNDTESAFAAGHDISYEGTVTDVKASFYGQQSSGNDYLGFGKHPSIHLFARERALGARGKGTAGPWHRVSWMDFDPSNLVDFSADDAELIGDSIFGRPSVTLVEAGFEIPMSTLDRRAKDTIDAIDKIARVCLDPQKAQNHELGSLAVLHVLPEQLERIAS